MQTVDTFGDFMSQWLRQEDVDQPGGVIEVVAAAERQEFEQTDGSTQKKIVLHFKGGTKPLPCNSTNRDAAMAIKGLTSKSKLDALIGTRVRIYRDPTVVMSGKRVGGVRLCDPAEDPTRKWHRPQPRTPHPGEAVYNIGEDRGDVDSLQSDPEWTEGRE